MMQAKALPPQGKPQRRTTLKFTQSYGPWALITGASSGIGRALAFEAAAAGLDLVLVARKSGPLETCAAEISQYYGVRTKIITADLAIPDAVATVISACAELEIGLVIAAAGFGTSGPFLNADLAVEQMMLATNCAASLALSQHFGRRLAERKRGGIILFSSVLAYQGVPYSAHYAATKAYIHALVEGIAAECKAHGVAVLACAPGPVRTGFGARAKMNLGAAADPAVIARETIAALGKKTIVVPGILAKLMTYGLAPVPRWLRVKIMGRAMARLIAP